MKRRDFLKGAIVAPIAGKTLLEINGEPLPEHSTALAMRDALLSKTKQIGIMDGEGTLLAWQVIEVPEDLPKGDTITISYEFTIM